MQPVSPRTESRPMPRVPADALPPHVRKVPPDGSHLRRNLTIGIVALGILALLLLALT